MKKISVIIPVYNSGQYVLETIHSILNQTYPVYEIIVVNDGSTDTTRQVVESIKNDFSQIILLNQENSGPAAARNNGIKNATGEYIAFCDADDLWVRNKIEKQMQVFESKDVQLVYSGIEFFGFKEGEFLPHGKNSPRQIFKNNTIPNSSVIIHRSVVDRVGLLHESKKFFAVEDYQYWLRIVTEYDFDYAPEPLVRYRVHDGQISKGNKKSYQRLINVYTWFLFQWKYRNYWDICFIKIIHNGLQYVRFSIFDICKTKKQ